MKSPARMALQSIADGAGRARLGDRLPEDRRPKRELLEALGLLDPEIEEVEGEIEEIEDIDEEDAEPLDVESDEDEDDDEE